MNEPTSDGYPFVDTSRWQAQAGTLPSYGYATELRPFNRFFLDRGDPLDDAGYALLDYELALSYPVDRMVQSAMIAQLHETVLDRFRTASVPGARPLLVDFDDDKTGASEAPRRYIVVRGETRRSTFMTVFASFLSNGDFFYVALDSFVLPPLHVWRLIWTSLFALFGYVGARAAGRAIGATFGILQNPLSLLVSDGTVSKSAVTGGWIAMAVFAVVLSCTYYRVVVRSLLAGDSLLLAFRRKFHHVGPDSTFDRDDARAFFKAALQLIITGIQDVFNAHGIPVDVLDRKVQVIVNSTTFENRGVIYAPKIVGGVGNFVA